MSAPITAERLAEIEARANGIHAEMSHTRTRCNHCDAVNPPLDEWGCHDGCPDAEEWPTKVERDGTKLEGFEGLREIAGHMTDLVAEVRRLTAALEIARREGRDAALRECRDIARAEQGVPDGAAHADFNAVECVARIAARIEALPLDAFGGES